MKVFKKIFLKSIRKNTSSASLLSRLKPESIQKKDAPNMEHPFLQQTFIIITLRQSSELPQHFQTYRRVCVTF